MPRTKKSEPVRQLETLAVTMNGPLGEVLTLSEAAAYLRLPEKDIVRTIHEQGLPARQIGSEWRFFKAAIQDWLSSGPSKPRSSREALLAMAGKFKDDP